MRIINANAKSRIRKIVVYTIYVFLLSSLQVSFPDAFGFLGQTADLMFVFVVLSGYFNGFWDGAVVGFVCGLIRDVLADKVPYVLVKHVYAIACIAGAAVTVVLWKFTGSEMISSILSNRQDEFAFIARFIIDVDRCGHIYDGMLQSRRIYTYLRMEPFGRFCFRHLFSAYFHYLFIPAAASAQYDRVCSFAFAY